MSRNQFACPHCGASLGFVNMPSRVYHPAKGVRVFINRDRDLVQVDCPSCPERIDVTTRRIAMVNLSP